LSTGLIGAVKSKMMKKLLTRELENIIWSIAVLFPVGAFSLGYILFKRDFAKLHFDFSCLNFPVFVGEVLLSYCVLLLIIWWFRNPPVRNRFNTFIFIYLFWFMCKAAWGYYIWGPLALRHAALFYYPFFFIIGYTFFNRQVFNRWSILISFFIIEGIFLWGDFDQYWDLTLGCLGFILILNVKDKKWAIPMALILVLSIPYLYMFKIARMMLLANVASILLLTVAVFYLLNTKLYIKAIIFVLISIGTGVGLYKSLILGESGRIFTTPKQVMDQFRETDKTIQQQELTYQRVPLHVGLYNGKFDKIEINYSNPSNSNTPSATAAAPVAALAVPARGHLTDGQDFPRGITNLEEYKNFLEWQSASNIIFRLLIWRDMIKEWNATKPLWGFDLGRPLRSPSLEVLHWAETEWGRDGWIEPHNSFLNMMYRAGIVGVIIVAVIWGSLIYFIQVAFKQKSWIYILLSAILLNWLVAANFLLILEFPYTAIPFWTLAGMAFAYAFKAKEITGAYETKR
jgi:hypothetical protein